MIRSEWKGAIVMVAVSLAGCGGPMGTDLVTDKGPEAYRASLEPLAAKMSQLEREAFDWGVSGYDLDKLNATYHNASPREIVLGEVKLVRDVYPKRMAELEKQKVAEAPVRAELAKVRAEGASFRIEKDFFGLAPKIEARIVNESSLPISALEWDAALYIDGKPEPVAKTTLNNDYRRDGGLKPGYQYTVNFKVGFVKGDESWTTLAIRNANSTRVVLTPRVVTVRDFADKPYLPSDTVQMIAELREAAAAAERFSSI